MSSPPTINAANLGLLSFLFEAVGDLLTDAQREELTAQLTSLRPSGVAPGDLITADLFNGMINNINDLLARVAVLEDGTSGTVRRPVITGFDPTIVRTGTQFAVLGTGLSPAHIQQIQIDDSLVPVSRIKPGSNSTRMLLDAPAIIGLPAAGGPVIMTLTNSEGNGQGTYTQLPGIAADIQANVAFVPQGLTPNETIVANKVYSVAVELDIHSSHDETFDIGASFGTAGWLVNSVTPATVSVTAASATAGQKQVVTIAIRTGASGSANLSLTVKGQNFTAFEQAMVPPLTIAIAQTTQLPSALIKFNNISVNGPHGWNGADPTVMIHRTSVGSPVATLLVLAQFDLADQFNFSVPVCQPSADWSATITNGQSFTNNAVGGTRQINVAITPARNATQFTAADGTITFNVTNQNGQHQRTFTAKLRVLS